MTKITMTQKGGLDLSIVVPTFNEEENVAQVHARVTKTFASTGLTYELLFVDDGSTDRTRELLAAMVKDDPCVRAVLLTRNFGHQAAVTAGLRHGRGRAIAVIDGDLQDPPEVLPAMLAKLDEGYAVAYGVRRQRKENFLKRAAYHGFYRVLDRFADISIPLDAGDFCVMDRRVVDFLNLLPEQGRFLRGLRAWVGLKQIGVEYEREARQAGVPKYTVRKLVELASSGVVSFSTRPLAIATKLGFLIAFGSAAMAAITFGRWLFGFADAPPGFLSLFIGLCFLFAMQFLLIGILGEYVGRIHAEVKRRPTFLVEDVLEGTAAETQAARALRSANEGAV